MDWTALRLSLALAAWTLAILVPLGIVAGRWLANTRSRSRPWLEALTAIASVLVPPSRATTSTSERALPWW